MVFINENAPLRTDESFLLRTNEEHHVGDSPFEKAGFKMITQFPLDYMHLICLGIMKRLLKFWITGVKELKLRSADIKKLSEDLKSLKDNIPKEMARKPRGIDELDRWKATEFRLFLLYTGLSVLPLYLPDNYLSHFYVLHCAISILCNASDCTYNNEYAKELLVYFVHIFKILYGDEHVIYNVHNLIHLNEDVKNHGHLDMFSAFPFENYFQSLKRMIKKSTKPLEQLQRRLIEKSQSITRTESEHPKYPFLSKPNGENIPFECTNPHNKVHFKNFTLFSGKNANSFCYINEKRIVMIEHIGKKDGELIVLGRVLQNSASLDLYPCDSRNIGIHVGDEWSELEVWPVSAISAKAIRLPYKNTFCIIPILHSPIKMFYVVTWENYCSAIPDLWLNLTIKNFLFSTAGINITNAVKKKTRPGNDWNVYEYRQVLGPFNTYELARTAEKTCIDISSFDEMQFSALSNQSAQTLTEKRVITKKRFFDEIVESSDDTDQSESNKQVKVKRSTIPKTPSGYKSREGGDRKSTQRDMLNEPLIPMKQKSTATTSSVRENISTNIPSLVGHPYSIEVYEDYEESHEGEEKLETCGTDESKISVNADLDRDSSSTDGRSSFPNEENISLHAIWEKMNSIEKQFKQWKTEYETGNAKILSKLKEVVAIMKDNVQSPSNVEVNESDGFFFLARVPYVNGRRVKNDTEI